VIDCAPGRLRLHAGAATQVGIYVSACVMHDLQPWHLDCLTCSGPCQTVLVAVGTSTRVMLNARRTQLEHSILSAKGSACGWYCGIPQSTSSGDPFDGGDGWRCAALSSGSCGLLPQLLARHSTMLLGSGLKQNLGLSCQAGNSCGNRGDVVGESHDAELASGIRRK
jgi:hypothetical protein